jgi:hypothetical protein
MKNDLRDFELDVRFSGEDVFINNEIYNKKEILELVKKLANCSAELLAAIDTRDLKD